MKKTSWILTMAVIVGALPFAAQAFDGRVGFADLDKVFSSYEKTRTAEAQLKKQAETIQEEHDEMVKAFEQLQEEFNEMREAAQNTLLSETARADKRNAAEEKLVEVREQESKIRRFDELKRRQLNEQSLRIRKDIVDEMQKIISAYAKREGFTLILDSSGQSLNNVPLVVFADVKLDVTDAIIAELNAQTTPAAP